MTPHLGEEQVQALQLATAIMHITVVHLRLTCLLVPTNSVGTANCDDLQVPKEK